VATHCVNEDRLDYSLDATSNFLLDYGEVFVADPREPLRQWHGYEVAFRCWFVSADIAELGFWYGGDPCLFADLFWLPRPQVSNSLMRLRKFNISGVNFALFVLVLQGLRWRFTKP